MNDFIVTLTAKTVKILCKRYMVSGFMIRHENIEVGVGNRGSIAEI